MFDVSGPSRQNLPVWITRHEGVISNREAERTRFDADRMGRCLTGIALGDSLGLPMEGLSAKRARKLFKGELRQRMAFGRGILSDDTLMAVATLQALHVSRDNAETFGLELAKRLRSWFWTFPPGIGLATLKSCLRLSIGIRPDKSGVNSAGNGPAVRAVVLGCAFSSDPAKRVEFIQASTLITHVHPTADQGAQIAGLAAALAAKGESNRFIDEANGLVSMWPWAERYPTSGPTGYMVHTVNATVECWQRHPGDLTAAIRMAVALGGDTDSVAALVGGIVACGNDTVTVPDDWYKWLGYPRPSDIAGIVSGTSTEFPLLRLRLSNLISLTLILPHALRRLLPPY